MQPTQQNQIVGYTAQGIPIYNTAPVSTPRLNAFQTAPTQEHNEPAQPMIWVDGILEAKSFRVAPGSTVVLWDSEEGRNYIYIKSTDTNGVPGKMRVLRYEEVDENPTAVVNAGVSGMTMENLNALIESKFDSLFEIRMKERRSKKPNHNNQREEVKRNEE